MATAAAPIGTLGIVDDGDDGDEEVILPMPSLGVGVGVDSINEVIVDKSSFGLEVVSALVDVEGSLAVSWIEEDSSTEEVSSEGPVSSTVEVSSAGGVSTSLSLDVAAVVVGSSTGIVVAGAASVGNGGRVPPEK